MTNQLALDGGPKTKTTPFGTGKRFGAREKELLCEVVDSEMMFYVFGTKVKEMQNVFKKLYGMKYCYGCSSGTAAVHIALGALGLKPGDEVITSSVTDMGTLTGVLYQLLIPRFADIDPETYNMTPESTKRLINKRTKAIILVHHAGLPVDIDGFMKLSKEYNIPLIEDCAQSYLTKYNGRLCGTFGDVSAFSLNHFKHITTGSGGMVMTNRDDLDENIRLFIDKCYFRDGRKRNPYFLATNYQMTELQGAVALAQFEKLDDIISRRIALGKRLSEGLRSIDGVIPHKVPQGSEHTCFFYVVRLATEMFSVSLDQFCKALAAEGISNAPCNITGGMPIYQYDIFKNRTAFPGTAFPFVSQDLQTDVKYSQGDCPVAEKAFDETFNLSISEFFTSDDIDDIVKAIRKVSEHYSVR